MLWSKELSGRFLIKCVQCYACVRNCPVKAVAIRDGKARIIQERCIHCGNCVKICSQNAKRSFERIDHTLHLLKEGKYNSNSSPLLPMAFNGRVENFPVPFGKLGFVQVWEVAVGAELVVEACRSFEFGGVSLYQFILSGGCQPYRKTLFPVCTLSHARCFSGNCNSQADKVLLSRRRL